MLERHRFALLGAALLYVGAGVLFLLMAIPSGRDLVQSVDDTVFELFEPVDAVVLTAGAQVMNFLGSVWVTLPIRLFVTGWLIARRRWEALWAWIGAAVLSELAITILKPLYGRERPPDPEVLTTGFSFPSGHSVAGSVTAIALVIVLVPAGPRRRYLEVLAAYFAFLMGMSRVYLGAHWLSDVVAGVALGAAIAIGTAAALHELGDRLHARRLQRSLTQRS
jgi:undecaprenyl-diphosphatase